MKPVAEKKLINHFKDLHSFSRQDLFNYFLQTEGEFKKSTLGWRIYDLKQKNILREIKRGFYTLNIKPVYILQIDDELKQLATVFTKAYRGAQYCLWNINWLNEFTVHQFNQDNIIFETEKDLIESITHTLGDHGYTAIISRLYGQLASYSRIKSLILLQPLISRAPVQQIELPAGKTISVPTLEKILVDVFSNEHIFHFVQGAEMESIFRNAIDRYAINYTTLIGYARRKGKDTRLQSYLVKHFPELALNIE